MKKILLIIVLISIVAGGTYQYMRMNTYSYHLDKAEAALDRIDAILEGNTPMALIPTAYAQDDKAIIDDANTAVDEIGEAQHVIDYISDSADRTNAQGELEETRTHAEGTLDAASAAVEGEDDKESIEDAQDALADIRPADNGRVDTGNQNPDLSEMSADRVDENGNLIKDDDEDYFDEDEDEDEEDEITDEKPIDEAEKTDTAEPSNDTDNTDYDAMYDAAEAAATERYQPYLDWKYGDPVPLEDQEQLDKDTAETPTIDPALMQDAIDKMMEQQ